MDRKAREGLYVFVTYTVSRHFLCLFTHLTLLCSSFALLTLKHVIAGTVFILQDIGIPSFLGGMARGLLGRNSSIQFRHCRRDALKEADLVILAGESVACCLFITVVIIYCWKTAQHWCVIAATS